jgi:hypothetical protein
MYRWVFAISVLILLALGVYFFLPNIRRATTRVSGFEDARVAYGAFMADHAYLDEIPDVNIVIVKNARILYLMSGDELVERWRVALGPHPEGTKENKRDGKTPTGDFYICSTEESSNIVALYLSYPSKTDADRGLNRKLIDSRRHDDIYSAIFNGDCPPFDTDLGGPVSIHGGGVIRDWTDGSIAVDDDVIKVLWGCAPVGTRVDIYENFDDWDLGPLMPSFIE